MAFCRYFVILVLMFVLGTSAEPQDLNNKFGTKTAYPLIETDWEGLARYAQIPDQCNLIHVRAVLRHGTRSYRSVDVDACQTAIDKIKASGKVGDGITQEQLDAIKNWQNVLPTNQELLERGRIENEFHAQNFYNLISKSPQMQGVSYQWDSSNVNRTIASAEAFRAKWQALTSTTLEPLEINNTRNLFQQNCSAYLDKVALNAYASIEYDKRGKTAIATAILDKINNKMLKLTGNNQLSYDDLESLYYIAATEVAAFGNRSVLLALFDDDDLSYLEYGDDLYSYWLGAYSVDPITRQMSCPLTNSIFETAEAAYANGPASQPSGFGFTHDVNLMTVYGAFGLFFDSRDGYVADSSRFFQQTRHFDTSDMATFAGNYAFLFYRCNEQAAPNDKLVLMMVNGQPRALPKACPFQLTCPLETVKAAYPLETGFPNQCNFDEICWPQAPTTEGPNGGSIIGTSVWMIAMALFISSQK